MVGRLPFAIEDLTREILQLGGDSSRIALMLDGPTFNAVIGELKHHGGKNMPFHPTVAANGAPAEYRYGAVSIVRA